MGGDDQTLIDSAEQTNVTSAEQENDSVDNAQNVEDNSSRSENLQGLSNLVQNNDVNAPTVCDGVFPLRRRSLEKSLLNSEFVNFNAKTFEKKSYNVSGQKIGFNVVYKPSDHKLNIVVPVMFMGATNLHALDEYDTRPTDMSAEVPTDYKKLYKRSIKRMWNNRYKFYLDVKTPNPNGLCLDWLYVSPVDVDVSVKESSNESKSYKVYYNPDVNYRDGVWPDYVIFSKDSFERERNRRRRKREQSTFAHEFGHQVGLDDEYTVDKATRDIYGNEVRHVYFDPNVEAYDRDTRKTEKYNFANMVGTVFSHNKQDFLVCSMTDLYGRTVYFLRENGNINGNIRGHALDGLYTSHTKMVARQFGRAYANKYATMYNENENPSSKSKLENNLMNGGNVFRPHNYITFLKGMIKAIRKDYKERPSRKAPNMETDWEIKK